MSYCRFENTYKDLQDCYDALTKYGSIKEAEENANQYDKKYISILVELCKEIVNDFGDEVDMQEEYIIVNKTIIQKRIEELEDERDGFIYNPNKTEDCICYNSKIELLKQLLSQSTPLIPEIEKAWKTSKEDMLMREYISNLKLNI